MSIYSLQPEFYSFDIWRKSKQVSQKYYFYFPTFSPEVLASATPNQVDHQSTEKRNLVPKQAVTSCQEIGDVCMLSNKTVLSRMWTIVCVMSILNLFLILLINVIQFSNLISSTENALMMKMTMTSYKWLVFSYFKRLALLFFLFLCLI